MLEILNLIFNSFWSWAGSVVILLILTFTIKRVVDKIVSEIKLFITKFKSKR